jgi:hypothetical protein
VTITAANSSGSDSKIVVLTVNSASGGPAGFTYIADEGGTYTFNQTVDVAYGANGFFQLPGRGDGECYLQ